MRYRMLIENNKTRIIPVCPDCGSPLNPQEGCFMCLVCGFALCGI
jgi:hypothetical protein